MRKVLLGILIGLFLSTISVLALSLCNAKDIEYNANDTTWDVDTVSDALNDLYQSNGSNPNDSCNNVAKPNLGTNNKLIPVIISDDGTITKVSKDDPNWYNYCEKKWANAVILNDGVAVPNDNQTIDDMDNIESMFVWIPKYKYRLWNVNIDGTNSTGSLKKVHSIDIVFDTTNTEDKEGISCKTPMISGDIGSCTNGEYMTHPAFISFGVNGFWVGKFETGHRTATKTTEAQASSNDSSLIVVKPNVYSWRSNTIKNIFEAAYNYERDLESHMMKNTEWGAVAYLSHSKYGVDSEVNVNNNSSYITGYIANTDSFQGAIPGPHDGGDALSIPWNSANSYAISTSGNISGIFDMSGGAWEYMASYRSGTYGGSGFSTKTPLVGTYDEKYYDSYNEASFASLFHFMILGDATGELGPFKTFTDSDGHDRQHSSWYNNYAGFVNNSHPWFYRGGYYQSAMLAGVFAFDLNQDGIASRLGSRLVLAPAN